MSQAFKQANRAILLALPACVRNNKAFTGVYAVFPVLSTSHGSGGRKNEWHAWPSIVTTACALAMTSTTAVSLAEAKPTAGPGPFSSAVPPSSPQPPGSSNEPTTNNPMEYDPITNEHTAQMTLSRKAAMELYAAGKYKRAEARFIEALEEAKKGFHEDDPHIASCKNNLAEFYRNTGQYDKAEALYKESIAQLEEIYGERHWLFVSALHNMAIMYDCKGDLLAAKTTMDRVLKLRHAMYGTKHPFYADSLYAYGHILVKLGGSDDVALKAMSDAISVLEDTEQVQVNVILYWLTEYAGKCREKGQLADACSALKKALHYLGNDKGEQVAQASEISENLLDVLTALHRWEEALEVVEGMVRTRTIMFGNSLVVAATLLRQAQIEMQLKKPGYQISATHNTRNAATIAKLGLNQSITGTLGWLGGPSQTKLAKKVQAGNLFGSASKTLASLLVAQSDLQGALAVYEEAVQELTQAVQQIDHVLRSPQLANNPQVNMEALSGGFIEMKLALIDCLDGLTDLLSKQPGVHEARIQQLQAQSERLAESLL